ncbi:unnamed protein product [Adineta steineri]|uniref:Uncharacterized protein n=2 Tax=Adineta steineri TaxID=433720 RepID=A0A814KUI7_9BILA|nr:unnamed protein product [Adineta steineri]
MRSFQVMRYGRRTLTPTAHELAQSINHCNTLPSIPQRRCSMCVYSHLQSQNSIYHDEDEKKVLQRRNTLTVQKSLPIADGINSSRRPSFNNGRRASFQQQEINESSKSKTNLRNFYVFFVLLFLFIFLAVVYSFIRMIKNQVS